MFTGIVETVGEVIDVVCKDDCKTFCIAPHHSWADWQLGESIAVNGVCLTLENFDANYFFVTAVPETLRVTNLHQIESGDEVNLERALISGARIGGHYVQGHVDGVGEVIDIQAGGDLALLVTIKIPKALAKFLINKGFVALDGMSITIISVEAEKFTVTFVPYTIEHSIVKHYRVGDRINIEVDMLAKYVEKIVENRYG